MRFRLKMDRLNFQNILNIASVEEFQEAALRVFNFQYHKNTIYAEYVNHLHINVKQVTTVDQIPFFPINFFKTHTILIAGHQPEIIFSSSGTTGTTQSKHYVSKVDYYEKSFEKAFRLFYGTPHDLAILALLPAYQEREGSSLIYMVNSLIEKSKVAESGYFLYNHEALANSLLALKKKRQKTILFGVTYALLDFIEQYPIDFPELIVMETGGMKGRRKEMIREELHERLTAGFGVTQIHSEYGMTELLSQAYSSGSGIFSCPPWMSIKIRDANDPLSLLHDGRAGGINVIDLANINSCAFIATQDLGKIYGDGKFEVLGRFDQSDIRGCNLLVQ